MGSEVRLVIAVIFLLIFLLHKPAFRWLRSYRYTRGRRVTKKKSVDRVVVDGLRWGNSLLPPSAAVRHFLVAGTTGSGKSLVQRLLMKDPLKRIRKGSDHRAVIFDAKGDMSAFLAHLNIKCPVYNFNPFASPTSWSRAVAWDIAKDITSPARAQNLVGSLLPSEKSGNNQYFTDAARQVLVGIVESLIRHSPLAWTSQSLCANTSSTIGSS